MKFTEAHLEQAVIELLGQENWPHTSGETLDRPLSSVLLEQDLRDFLQQQYASDNITPAELEAILNQIRSFPASDLYNSNRKFLNLLANGETFKRHQHKAKDFHLYLLDWSAKDRNNYRVVSQFRIEGQEENRIPDLILFVNGLPLVVFELKSLSREEPRIEDAYKQLTVRYRRDIPELFVYNAFAVISDGANSKAGNIFSAAEHWYAWRRVAGAAEDVDGIEALYTLIQGMFQRVRFRDICRNFIYLPDVPQPGKSEKGEMKIVCRYPQYYAARKLYQNILEHQKPEGDGKGGTYFGATGSGKSYTMLFLARLLMKSMDFASPTLILITDRTDLDDQLSGQFSKAKTFLGDNRVVSVGSREELQNLLKGIQSGGVFLTTIHKFTEEAKLLTNRTNVICISDEAHRSQTNLEQKVRVTEKGVKKTYGFAKYLHDSLPNATYVGFTGTPIDATLDVFGPVVDAYTMTESVRDKITVPITYEGRAAKVFLQDRVLNEIEEYYKKAEELGANENQIKESKQQMSTMKAIIGHPDRLQAVAEDFVKHYETRVEEGASPVGKAMFVCASRDIAWDLYKRLGELRPEWLEVKAAEENSELSEKEQKELMALPRMHLVMTRGKDDSKALWDHLGNKSYRKTLDGQFKKKESNFKIAIVVDMWLTGFDVPFLDTMYIDKPIQRHTLVQTISRVNRTWPGKNKGLVVDYLGIKKQMDQALALFGSADQHQVEDIGQTLAVLRDLLVTLAQFFHKFDAKGYFEGGPVEQLDALKRGGEFVLQSPSLQSRFMGLSKRLKAAYDVCAGSDELSSQERDFVHFYLAIRSYLFKLTKGNAPDTAEMNRKVAKLIEEAIESDGVQEIVKWGAEKEGVNIFDQAYLDRLNQIKLPKTKLQLLQRLLNKAISEMQKVNKLKGVEFSKRFRNVVDRYNERQEAVGPEQGSIILDEASQSLVNLYLEMIAENQIAVDLGIDYQEKAFYDILHKLTAKHNFNYPEDKLMFLAKEVKKIVEDKRKYVDWQKKTAVKAKLKAEIMILLSQHGYPPVVIKEVYEEVVEQAENYKANL